MKLWRAKVWSVLDIGLLKWCCILIGMIAGAYGASFVRNHVVAFAVAAILLAVKPTVSYFRPDPS